MERVLWTLLNLVLVVIVNALTMRAYGDVTFRSADKYNPWEEAYPQSAWGSDPARVDLKSSIPNPGRSLASVPAGTTPGEDPFRPATLSKDTPISGGPMDLIPDKQKGVQEVSVIVSDLGYFPRTIFVTRTVPVRLFVTGASKSSLCIMMEPFNVMRQVRQNDVTEISFTPNTSGQFRFHCPVNNLEGTLVVRDLASQQAPLESVPAQ